MKSMYLSTWTESLTGRNKFWTHWQWYRRFFHVAFLRYLAVWFAFVPVFANLFQKLPHEIDIVAGESKFALVIGLPFTWELLWLSSFLFMVAYALYALSCPRFVKNYSSYADYKAHMHSPRWIVWEARELAKDKNELPRLVERLLTKHYLRVVSPQDAETITTPNIIVEEKQTALYLQDKNVKYRLAMPILDSCQHEDKEATAIAEREIFWEVFGRVSSSRHVIRLVIITLLLGSLLLFLFVLGQHICAALRYLIS